MNKQDEIKCLQSLKGDTYFAQIFKPETIDAMCENIRLDRQIDCLVNMFANLPEVLKLKSQVNTLEKELAEAKNDINKLNEERDDWMDFLLKAAEDAVYPMDKEITEKVVAAIGKKEMIRKKLKLNIELSDEDKDWLYNNI